MQALLAYNLAKAQARPTDSRRRGCGRAIATYPRGIFTWPGTIARICWGEVVSLVTAIPRLKFRRESAKQKILQKA